MVKLGVRATLTAALLCCSAAGFAGAWFLYLQTAAVDLPEPPAAGREPEENLAELEVLFDRPPQDPARYEVVEQANLFAEDRKALPRLGEGKADEPAVPLELTLLGTTRMGQDKRALLRVEGGQPPTVLVQEGMTLSGGAYSVVSIEEGKVVLRRGGETLSLTLPPPDPGRRKELGAEVAAPDDGSPQGKPPRPAAAARPAPAKPAAPVAKPPANRPTPRPAAQAARPARPQAGQAQPPAVQQQPAGQQPPAQQARPGQQGTAPPPGASGWTVKN